MHKESAAFRGPIFIRLVNFDLDFSRMHFTEFNANLEMNVKNTDITFFTPLSKVCLQWRPLYFVYCSSVEKCVVCKQKFV
jgi:hypothetical protein